MSHDENKMKPKRSPGEIELPTTLAFRGENCEFQGGSSIELPFYQVIFFESWS